MNRNQTVEEISEIGNMYICIICRCMCRSREMSWNVRGDIVEKSNVKIQDLVGCLI